MSIRTIATLAIAVALGLVAVFILNSYLGAPHKAQTPQPIVATIGTPVVIATTPIARGATLQPQLLKVVNYPQSSVPAGAFADVGQLTGAKAVQRLALRNITPGEPILPGSVSDPGGRLNLASMIDPGMQAVAIRSSDVAGVGGFVLPGDRVDVLLTRATSNSQVTQILAENLRVLAIDQTDDEATDKPAVARTITIQVTPQQAQTITLGQAAGQISLALRHVTDTAPLARHATTLAALGYTAPAAAPTNTSGDPLNGPGVIRVTRVTDVTGYRLGAR